jgi:hypothetical protein
MAASFAEPPCRRELGGEIDLIGDVRKEAQFEMMRPRIRAALETW